MDVHRSRFVPYPVTPITAVAFSRSHDRGLRPAQPRPSLKLAVGRQNGDIEIWNPLQGQWVQETVLLGEGRSIDGLTWTQEPDELDADGQLVLGQHRLFSIASSPAVVEWNLEQGQPERESTGNFSEVWCFASQPRQELKQGRTAQARDIVAGCGDGTIVLLSTADNDLQFKRFVARVSGKKAKCMSITYQNQDRILAGFMDSTIRIFDTRNGSNVRTMSLGAGLPGAPKNAIVWQVRSLANGDIVSGDSNGEVILWDGRSYTLSQRIKAHDSECLDLVVSADGKTVLSGSNNGRLAVIRQTTTAGGRHSWAKSHHRRMHGGQVKAMAAFDGDALSVVVSGGDDYVPVITPLRQYGKEHHRLLPTLPQASPVASARHARLIVSWWDKSISIWRIARRGSLDLDSSTAQPSRRLVARLSLAVKDIISSVAITDDGRVLAAATASEVKDFQLRRRSEADGLKVRKLETPKALSSSGASILKISPNGQWLAAVSLDNDLQVARLAPVPSKPKHIQVLKKIVELDRLESHDGPQSAFMQYDRSITKIDFAFDSSVLACGDRTGRLDCWVLEGREDTTASAVDVLRHKSKKEDSDDSSDSSDEEEVVIFYGQHWADSPARKLLPKLDSAPLVFTFRPTPHLVDLGATNGNPGVHSTRHNPHAHSNELPHGQHLLWIMTAQHKMYEFDVLQGRLSDWSRQNPSSVLPADLTNLTDRVKDAVWDVSAQRQRLWLFGNSWTFMLNVGGNLAVKPSRKRRKAEGEEVKAKRLKSGSGAGVAKSAGHRPALPETIKRYEDGEWEEQLLDRPRVKSTNGANNHAEDSDNDSDDDDAPYGNVDEEAESRLRLTRMAVDETGQEQGDQQEVPWWCTYKYRPILGVVPVDVAAATSAAKTLEVVIVERPLWDVKDEAK